MKVNSVASYNNQLQNRTNVKFGDCKKIVCNQYMTKAKETFENSSLKSYLDKNYIYEVYFTRDIPYDPMNKKANIYEMTLMPYKASLLEKCKRWFKKETLPNLPHEIRFSSTSLEDAKYKYFPPTTGLNTIIAKLGESDISGILSQYIK